MQNLHATSAESTVLPFVLPEPANAKDVTMPAVYVVQRASNHELTKLLPITPGQAAALKWGGELPAVVYEDLANYGDSPVSGFCSSYPTMPNHGGGEVVLDKNMAEGVMSERVRAKRVAMVYFHEIAHRLVPDESHGPVFASVCAALTVRGFDSENEAIKCLGWYEVQDCPEGELGGAFAHAIEFARAHHRSDATAHDLPRLAAESWAAARDSAWDGMWKRAVAQAESNLFDKHAKDLELAWDYNSDLSRKLTEQAADAQVRADQLAIGNAKLSRQLKKTEARMVEVETLPWRQIASIALFAMIFGAIVATQVMH